MNYFEDSETFILKQHINIETARKDICYESTETYDESNSAHVSEWAMAIAMQAFKINQEIRIGELQTAIDNAKAQQTLDSMVDKGLIAMSWNGDEPVYGLTELGNKLGQAIQDSKEGK